MTTGQPWRHIDPSDPVIVEIRTEIREVRDYMQQTRGALRLSAVVLGLLVGPLFYLIARLAFGS